jgi:AsmA protein
MIKKILIALGVLVVVVVAGLVLLLTQVDVDHYKPELESAARDKLDRTLTFEGRLSLSVFPTIAVSLPRTTLSEKGSDKPFLILEHARVSLAVLPLFAGRLEAGTASLYGLRVAVERHADGTSSVDDLTGAGKPKEPGEAKPAASGGKVRAFDLGGIEVEDAEAVYLDEKTHDTIRLTKLNLSTGRIGSQASTPLTLSAAVSSTAPQAAFDLTLKGTADIDLPQKAYGIRGLDAHLNGHVDQDTIAVDVTAPRIAVDPAHASGEQLKVVAAVSGAHVARVEMSLDKLAGSLEDLQVTALALDASAEQGPQKINAHLASPLQVGVAAQTIELPKLAGTLDIAAPGLPQKTVKVALDGALRVAAKEQNIAGKLGARFDDTTATSQFTVQGFAGPHIHFDVDLDQFNLDRYLPPPAPGTPAPAPAKTPPAAAEDAKIDLSALKPLNLSGELRVGALQAHQLKATRIKAVLHAADGRLDLAPLAADLYEGHLEGSAHADAKVNDFAGDAALKGVSIGPLVKDLTGKDLLEGHGEVNYRLSTQGPTVGALRRGLDGTASLALRDGAVRGINIAAKLRDLKATFSGGSSAPEASDPNQKTDFSELTASFVIRKGVASNADLLGKSPLLRLNGDGTIDIGAGTLDYTVKATVVGTLAGQGGSDLAKLHGVTVPVHLTGPFAALSYQLDWGSIAAQAAKSQATDKIKSLLGDKLKSGSLPGGNKAADALKGLLGK